MFRRFVTLMALLALLGACTATQPESTGSGRKLVGGEWRRLSRSPLEKRHSAHAFRLSDRVLILGGSAEPPCAPNASCLGSPNPPLRDGASFDAASGRWEQIADAPVPIGGATGTVLQGILYLWVSGSERAPSGAPPPDVRPAFLAYRADTDTWEELPAPPGGAEDLRLVAGGHRVIAFHTTQERGVFPDLSFDPRAGSWSELPRDPLVASFDRAMVWTGSELFLLALENVPNPNSERPSLYRAASFDPASGAWRRQADSEIVFWGPDWFWTGGRIVNPWVGTSDGGWERAYPWGGSLDPDSGVWFSLPDTGGNGSYDGPPLGGTELAVTVGRVLHVAGGSWLELDAPPSRPDEGEASVMIAGDRIFVFGGYAFERRALLGEAWIWDPHWRSERQF